jgi:hypothetical protein
MYQPATGDLVYHPFFKPSLSFIAILQGPLPQSQPHVWFSFHTAEAYIIKAERGIMSLSALITVAMPLIEGKRKEE